MRNAFLQCVLTGQVLCLFTLQSKIRTFTVWCAITVGGVGPMKFHNGQSFSAQYNRNKNLVTQEIHTHTHKGPTNFVHLRHKVSKFKYILITHLIIGTVIFISFGCHLEGQLKLFLWLIWVVMFCHDLLLNSESAEMFSRQPCINIEFISHGISDAVLGSSSNCCAIFYFMAELYGLHSLI